MTTAAVAGYPAGCRVLILGEDAPGALMHSYAAAFGRLGWRVETYCLVTAYRAGLGSAATRVGRRVAPRLMAQRLGIRLLDDVGGRAPELVFVIKGEQLLPSTIKELQSATGSSVVNFYPDDPFADVRSNRALAGAGVLQAYDHCYSFARHLVGEYQRRGVSRVSWLPFARDPDQHAPVAASQPPEFDLVFVGTLDAGRILWLEPLARRFRLAIFGEHTLAAVGRGSSLKRATFLPAQYGRDLAHAMARGAISVNVMRNQNRFSHNMRSFESLACGAFTLSQWTAELEDLFRADEEVVFARDPEEMVRVAECWLRQPEERRRVAANGFARVEHDTYDVRAQTIARELVLHQRRA